MTRDIRNITAMIDRERDEDMGIVSDKCNCSGYTMAAVAGCLLFCLGVIIYALIAG